MQQIKAIISDSDGTLVDTLYLIRRGQYEAAVEYLIKIGVSQNDIPDYGQYEIAINKSVGGNTRNTFERTFNLLFEEKKEIIERTDFDELDRSLGAIQDTIAPGCLKAFAGFEELLTWSGKHDIAFGIFTSGSQHHIIRNLGIALPALECSNLYLSKDLTTDEQFSKFIERVKKVYGISKFAVVTCEDVANTKPDPEGILKLVNIFGNETKEAIVMGDHTSDMQAAKRAGILSIGVIHGFGSAEELREAGAMNVINSLQELPSHIETFSNNKERLG